MTEPLTKIVSIVEKWLKMTQNNYVFNFFQGSVKIPGTLCIILNTLCWRYEIETIIIIMTKTSEIRSDNMTTTRQNDVSFAYCNCSSRNEVNKHELPRDDVVEKKTWNIQKKRKSRSCLL